MIETVIQDYRNPFSDKFTLEVCNTQCTTTPPRDLKRYYLSGIETQNVTILHFLSDWILSTLTILMALFLDNIDQSEEILSWSDPEELY